MSKAANTRLMIMQKAFDLIYKNGYQATSIDTILATTKVTKGAFFYHFKNKDEMGLAMLNEIIYPGMYASWVTPLIDTQNPATDIYEMMRNVLLKVPFLRSKYGCPVVNLLEEMSPLNEDFKAGLLKPLNEWRQAIAQSIKKGKTTNQVREDIDPAQAAMFIVAGYCGIRGMGKAMGTACYAVYLQELKNYLQQLG